MGIVGKLFGYIDEELRPDLVKGFFGLLISGFSFAAGRVIKFSNGNES